MKIIKLACCLLLLSFTALSETIESLPNDPVICAGFSDLNSSYCYDPTAVPQTCYCQSRLSPLSWHAVQVTANSWGGGLGLTPLAQTGISQIYSNWQENLDAWKNPAGGGGGSIGSAPIPDPTICLLICAASPEIAPPSNANPNNHYTKYGIEIFPETVTPNSNYVLFAPHLDGSVGGDCYNSSNTKISGLSGNAAECYNQVYPGQAQSVSQYAEQVDCNSAFTNYVSNQIPSLDPSKQVEATVFAAQMLNCCTCTYQGDCTNLIANTGLVSASSSAPRPLTRPQLDYMCQDMDAFYGVTQTPQNYNAPNLITSPAYTPGMNCSAEPSALNYCGAVCQFTANWNPSNPFGSAYISLADQDSSQWCNWSTAYASGYYCAYAPGMCWDELNQLYTCPSQADLNANRVIMAYSDWCQSERDYALAPPNEVNGVQGDVGVTWFCPSNPAQGYIANTFIDLENGGLTSYNANGCPVGCLNSCPILNSASYANAYNQYVPSSWSNSKQGSPTTSMETYIIVEDGSVLCPFDGNLYATVSECECVGFASAWCHGNTSEALGWTDYNPSAKQPLAFSCGNSGGYISVNSCTGVEGPPNVVGYASEEGYCKYQAQTWCSDNVAGGQVRFFSWNSDNPTTASFDCLNLNAGSAFAVTLNNCHGPMSGANLSQQSVPLCPPSSNGLAYGFAFCDPNLSDLLTCNASVATDVGQGTCASSCYVRATQSSCTASCTPSTYNWETGQNEYIYSCTVGGQTCYFSGAQQYAICNNSYCTPVPAQPITCTAKNPLSSIAPTQSMYDAALCQSNGTGGFDLVCMDTGGGYTTPVCSNGSAPICN